MKQKVRYRIYAMIDCPSGEGINGVLDRIRDEGEAVIIDVELVDDESECPTDLEEDFWKVKK